MTPALRRIALMIAAVVASIPIALSASPAQADAIVDVHRFWSPAYSNAHFYTMDSGEAEQIRATNANWVYEGVAFKARSSTSGGCSVGIPVFRFWSAGYRTHFYTADKSESDQIRATNANWAYEGIAYCADSGPQNGGAPLYRFWSPAYRNHFYTADKSESDQIRATNRNWTYEGIAYYVNPAPTPTPTTPAPTNLLPAQVLNLTKWKLDTPVDGPDNDTPPVADVVKQPALSTFEASPWFETVSNTTASQGVRFRADTSGVTTSGSPFPRSELREMDDTQGQIESAWENSDSKTHTMTIDQAITHLPSRTNSSGWNIDPLVAGQIHDDGEDILVLRAQKNSAGKIELIAWDGFGVKTVLDSDYTLNERFQIQFSSVGTNVTMTYTNPSASPTSTTATRTLASLPGPGSDWYFKAGCYTQASSRLDPSDSQYGTGYGEVIIYGVTVTHQ